MDRYFKAWTMIAALTLALLAGSLLAAGPATKPAEATTTSAPAAEGKVWNLPGIARMGYFTVSDGQYAIVQDQPPPPDPNPAPLQPGQTPPPPPTGKWYLVDLNTGKVVNLIDALKACSGDFKADDLSWADFSPDGKALLLTTGGVGVRTPWWFDLTNKKALPLSDPTGTQCIWMGDKVIQYEPRAIQAGGILAVPIAGRVMDLAKNKTAPYTLPGTIVAVNDKGTHFVSTGMQRIVRKPPRPVYALYALGSKPNQGAPLSGITTPAPQFVISPGAKYLLAMAYDDKPGAVAALSVKTCVIALSGRKPMPLAQTNPPLYISDAGRAMTRTDKGVIQIWDLKGKECEEIVKESAAAGVWNCNLYYLVGNEQKMQIFMKPLPQMKMPDPKSKPAVTAG